jgi:hypothetical protein
MSWGMSRSRLTSRVLAIAYAPSRRAILGDFALSIVVYAPAKGEIDHLVGVFTNAVSNLFVETYNQQCVLCDSAR